MKLVRTLEKPIHREAGKPIIGSDKKKKSEKRIIGADKKTKLLGKLIIGADKKRMEKSGKLIAGEEPPAKRRKISKGTKKKYNHCT